MTPIGIPVPSGPGKSGPSRTGGAFHGFFTVFERSMSRPVRQRCSQVPTIFLPGKKRREIRYSIFHFDFHPRNGSNGES